MKSVTSSGKSSVSGTLCALALAGLGFVLASGCSRSEAAPSKAGAEESAVGPAASRHETDTYVIEMTTGGPYKAGTEGTVDVVVSAKGDYKINKQYPYKFKVIDPAPEGVTFPKPVLQKADGTFEEKKGVFKVPFVPAKPGKAKVAGTLYISVCSDANCIMDKQVLEREVDVK